MNEIMNSFLIPLVLTVIIEMAVAYLMGIRGRRNCFLILLVNIMTNVTINWLHGILFKWFDNSGTVIIYTAGEMIVVLAEYCLYRKDLNTDTSIWKYALLANTASVLGGIIWKSL